MRKHLYIAPSIPWVKGLFEMFRFHVALSARYRLDGGRRKWNILKKTIDPRNTWSPVLNLGMQRNMDECDLLVEFDLGLFMSDR